MLRKSSASRLGFTLIELLVVIAIIAVLMGLLIPAVMGILKKGPDLGDVNDIRQMELGIANFRGKLSEFPSKIILHKHRLRYGNPLPGSLEFASLNYINKIWPRLSSGPFNNPPANPVGIDWSGNNDPASYPDAGITLEGDQCLVFFLGGPGGTQGFSTNPTNPVQPGGDRVGPFFEFKSSRLKVRPTLDPALTPVTHQAFFPSYYDNFDQQPYVYFFAGKKKNGYDLTHAIPGLEVMPYYDQYRLVGTVYVPINYLNPTSFQIIGAGADGRFADAANTVPPGTAVIPQRGHWNNGMSNDPTSFWRDNRTNFNSLVLEAAGN
ncbi:MAG: prepilin-type N-terminal cleavage/methylation domain-containing protein [Gemmataceae bacterium]|nr:prepilin-type N-terminal cleavage/methylation domain-containing protein [Gemmataceae bacterium]